MLDGISLRIRPGDCVAIVGPSGSGKSTGYRLPCGFERPDSGAVLFDGHDLRSLEVRRHFGVVLQDGQTGARQHPEQRLRSFAFQHRRGLGGNPSSRSGGRHQEDADGAAHDAARGGSGLSGGQRQRLLIVRALARRPRILLLDEATSTLDNHTQSVVQDALGRLSVTRIVIAHRLSTVRDVDRLYVLDGGRIAESGRYDELIGRNGRFAELANRQVG